MAQTASPAGEPMIPPPRSARSGQEPVYRVLLLYSESRLTPSVVSVDEAFRSTLQARSPVPVYFYTEFLDLNSFHGAALQSELRELLRLKYRERPIDLIVVQGQLAVPFALQNRVELFSSAPVVLVAVEASTFADVSLESVATGTWRRRGWAETLDLARHLHPATRRAVVIVGSSTGERFWAATARQQLAAHAGSIEIRYLVDWPFEDVLKAAAAFPKDTVVLAGPFLRDGTGRDFATPWAVSRIAAVSGAPVYGLTEASIGAGVVGGHVLSFEAHGKVAAELALRVLAGERPSPTEAGTTVPMFDDRQLKRWSIDRRHLPVGSVVRFREPSLWELYRGYIVAAGGLVLAQSGLIAGLLVQRAQRRRAQRSLAERLRFETLLSDLSAMLSSCPAAEVDRQVETGLRRIVEDLGVDRAAIRALDDRSDEARLTHSWIREGVPPPETVVEESEAPRVLSRLRQGHAVRLPPSGGPTGEALLNRQYLARSGTGSSAVVPLIEGNSVVGSLSVDAGSKSTAGPTS